MVRASIFSDAPPICLDQDCVGRHWTGTRHDNVYRSVREKHLVYRQHVLQTVTSLGVVSLVLSAGHELLEITNFNPSKKPDQFRYGKTSSPRERRKWSLGLGHN